MIMGVTELRRNPQKVFSLAKRQRQLILVTEFNKPQGIIVPLEIFDDIVKTLNALELKDALDSVNVYEREKESGALAELKSLKDLVEDEN